jgi:hypothetical protein
MTDEQDAKFWSDIRKIRADNEQVREELAALQKTVSVLLEGQQRVQRGIACVEEHYGPLDGDEE